MLKINKIFDIHTKIIHKRARSDAKRNSQRLVVKKSTNKSSSRVSSNKSRRNEQNYKSNANSYKDAKISVIDGAAHKQHFKKNQQIINDHLESLTLSESKIAKTTKNAKLINELENSNKNSSKKILAKDFKRITIGEPSKSYHSYKDNFDLINKHYKSKSTKHKPATSSVVSTGKNSCMMAEVANDLNFDNYPIIGKKKVLPSLLSQHYIQLNYMTTDSSSRKVQYPLQVAEQISKYHPAKSAIKIKRKY